MSIHSVTSTLGQAPDNLLGYVKTRLDEPCFHLRVMACQSETNSEWALLQATASATYTNSQSNFSQYRYPGVYLFEQILNGKECQSLFDAINTENSVHWGDIEIKCHPQPQWQSEFVALKNGYMKRAGWVFRVRSFERPQNTPYDSPLITLDNPFYPGVIDAVNEWLDVPYRDSSSQINSGELIFLLPQNKAYFESFNESDQENVRICFGGIDVGTRPIKLKGGYYLSRELVQIEKDVVGNELNISLPKDTQRIELYLLDKTGNILDVHRENEYTDTGLGRIRLLTSHTKQLRLLSNALKKGEGTTIEFKPFIRLVQPLQVKGKKTKLKELINTVIAFANTEGGHIFIGVDDECVVEGIQQHLSNGEQKKGLFYESAEHYSGAVLNKIRDHIVGEVHLEVSVVHVNENTVVVIKVSPAASKTLHEKEERSIWVRVGSNNKRLPPNEWYSPPTEDFSSI